MKQATTAFALLLIAAMLVYAAPAPPGGSDCPDYPDYPDCPDRITPVMKVQIRSIENDSAMIPVIIILKHAEQMRSGRAAQMGASSTSGRLGVLDDDHGTSDVSGQTYRISAPTDSAGALCQPHAHRLTETAAAVAAGDAVVGVAGLRAKLMQTSHCVSASSGRS